MRPRRAEATLAAVCVVAATLAACGSSGPDRAADRRRVVTKRSVTGLVLDPTHDYGDEYADGILPVGDGRYVLDAPRRGQIFLCHAGGGGGGATSRGPWFVDGGTEYDVNEKVHVQGEVHWVGTYADEVEGATRVIATDAVPRDHPTGQFPVAPTDPAALYDRNPNHIEEQQLTYRLA